MRQPKFFSFSDPKKTTAIVVATFAFFLIIGELRRYVHFPSSEKNLKPQVSQFSLPRFQLTDNSALFSNSLFGDYIPAQLDTADIKKSRLAAEIVGIMCAENAEESHAVIRTGELEKTYEIGDSLSGDAVIKRILPQSVVILHDGLLESLSLPKNSLSFEAPAKPLIEE